MSKFLDSLKKELEDKLFIDSNTNIKIDSVYDVDYYFEDDNTITSTIKFDVNIEDVIPDNVKLNNGKDVSNLKYKTFSNIMFEMILNEYDNVWIGDKITNIIFLSDDLNFEYEIGNLTEEDELLFVNLLYNPTFNKELLDFYENLENYVKLDSKIIISEDPNN